MSRVFFALRGSLMTAACAAIVAGSAQAQDGIELTGANGRKAQFAGASEATPAGLVVRPKGSQPDFTLAWAQLDAAALERDWPQLAAARRKADESGSGIAVNLGVFERVPVVLDAAQLAPLIVPDPSGNLTKPGLPGFRFKHPSEGEMALRLFTPPDKFKLEKLPIVVWLHGSGGNGIDNNKNVNGPFADFFAGPKVQNQHPCYVIAPQCPQGKFWSNGHMAAGKDPVDVVIEMIGYLLPRLPEADPARVYFSGYSMGGFGSMRAAMEYPSALAAAVPMAGAASDDEFRGIKRVAPTWLFFNVGDEFHLRWFRECETSLKKLGPWHRVTAYEKGSHGSTSQALEEPELLPWLFSKRQLTPVWPTPK